MRDKTVVKEEMQELADQIKKLQSRHYTLFQEHMAIELAEASESLRFPVGTILTRYHGWKGKTLRVIYRGVRQGRYGRLENFATNIKQNGKEGAEIQIYWHDGWKASEV